MMLTRGCKNYYELFATDIGLYYYNQKDDEKTFKLFERAFQLLITEATVNNLVILYMNIIGVGKYIKKAEEFFNIEIERGYSSSFYHLAFIMIYNNGDGFKQDN